MYMKSNLCVLSCSSLTQSFLSIVVTAIVLQLPVVSIPAATISWINNTGGSWHAPNNWSGGLVPTSSDTVIISADGTYDVVVTETISFTSLILGGGTGTKTLKWQGAQCLVTT